MTVAIDVGGISDSTRYTFAANEITIGSASGCTLALPGLAAHHCTIEVRAAGCFLVLKAGATTFVNAREAAASTAIYASDRVDVGKHVFTVERLGAERSPVELDLLASIKAGDAAARHVYADWLDENGDPRRAEFLRCQNALEGLLPTAPTFVPLTHRLRQLSFVLDAEWRLEVAVALVENCDSAGYSFACPRRWDSLTPTDRSDRRMCTSCGEVVYYCDNVNLARQHVTRGHCVVIDLTAKREPDDLHPQPLPPMPGRMVLR